MLSLSLKNFDNYITSLKIKEKTNIDCINLTMNLYHRLILFQTTLKTTLNFIETPQIKLERQPIR